MLTEPTTLLLMIYAFLPARLFVGLIRALHRSERGLLIAVGAGLAVSIPVFSCSRRGCGS